MNTKSLINRAGYLMLGIVLMGVLQPWSATAQKKKQDKSRPQPRNQVHIRIERDENGKKKVYEHTYESDDPARPFVFSLPDSLSDEFSGVFGEENGRPDRLFSPRSFFPDEPGDSSWQKRGFSFFGRGDSDSLFRERLGDIRALIQADGVRPFEFRALVPEFRNDSGRGEQFEFSDRDYNLEERRTDQGSTYVITRKKKPAVVGNADLNAGTIRELRVEPAADKGLFKATFTLPERGNVLVVVTDTEGKEVKRELLKDISGAYTYQLDLKKQKAGVYFATFTRNNDGLVRKIVIP